MATTPQVGASEFKGFLATALHNASLGYRVFPTTILDADGKPTKKPCLKGFPELATTDVSAICEWADDFPDATGCGLLATPDGYLFIDEDDSAVFRDGYERFAGDLFPATRTTCSRPNHCQSHWRQTEYSRTKLKNITQNKTKDQMFSLRFHNLYVQGEGSLHPSGSVYRLVVNAPAAPIPDKLVDYILSLVVKAPKESQRAATVAEIRSVPKTAASRPAAARRPVPPQFDVTIEEGGRNSAVSEYAWHVYQNETTDPDEFLQIVSDYNSVYCEVPLEESEVAAIVRGKLDKPVTGANAVICNPEATVSAEPKIEAVAPEKVLEGKQHDSSCLCAKCAKRRKIVSSDAEFDPSAQIPDRVYHYDALLSFPLYVLWLGARKAEKSLFALRKAMTDACGGDWLNHRNLFGPVKVLYFDAENSVSDVSERYHEIIREFSPEQQELIRKNLVVIQGRVLKANGLDFDWQNYEYWSGLSKIHKDVRAVYLDCWYQLQDIKPADNALQKKAVENFWRLFPKATIFLLHHTGRESDESLQKKHPAHLRMIGPERWSNKASGGNVLTKAHEMVICQERYESRDKDGSVIDEKIDLWVYSRSMDSFPLLSFEKVYEENGSEFKYRRRLVSGLSNAASFVLSQLKDKGPWKSVSGIVKDVGRRDGRVYKAIQELRFKGFLARDTDADSSYYVRYSSEFAPQAEEAAHQTARDFLSNVLKPLEAGMPVENLFELARQQGITENALRIAKIREGVLKEVHKTTDRDYEYWLYPREIPDSDEPKVRRQSTKSSRKKRTRGFDGSVEKMQEKN